MGLKVIRLNDAGGSYTFVDDGSLQGNVKIQRKYSNGSVRYLQYTDETTFDQMVISGSSACMNYYTLKKTSGTSNSSTTYSGTDILNDWVASWEDISLFLYRKGLGSYNSTVAKQMTEDGKYYICTGDGTNNGTLNYGFGVCVYNPAERGGWMQVESFAKYGVDITQSVLNQTQVEVDIVDKVKAEELQRHYDYITGKLNSAGVQLNEEQINALCGIAYQFGDGGANIDSFIQLYKQYGNTEELRQRYTSKGGTQLFVHVKGGTNSEGIDRAAANWGLFHDGIYYAGSGGTLDKSQYGSSAVGGVNNNQNVQVDNGNFTGSSNAEIAWNFFKSMGLNDVSTAAIVGNLMLESGGNTKNINPEADNGSHRGIAQWDYSDRYARLKRYASSVNGNPDDLNIQLQFLWLELSPTADHTYANPRFSQDTYNTFIAYNSVSEATKYFAQKFEGCTEALRSRQKNAESIYAELSGTGGTTNSTSISSLNNFLFIGDSRYEGSKYISELGNDIKNAGVVSANIKEWITVVENGGKGTVQGKSVDISGTYSGISIQLGANGIYNNVGNTETEMKTLIEKLKNLYPNTPIFVNGCLQVSPKANSAGYSWDANTYKDNISEFNNDISNYCNQIENVYYVDISSNLYDENGFLKDEYTSDGLHCNDAGAKIFADNIKAGILKIATSINNANQTDDSATSNGNTYVLVVANEKIVDTKVVDSYSYDSTIVTETTNGYTHSGTQTTSTPGPQTVSSNRIVTFNSTHIDYQTALKNYTLYFDFLWAILVNSGDKDFTLSWADLAANSNVVITVYSEQSSNTSESSEGKGKISRSSYNQQSGVAIVDYYNITETTTVTTTSITSKGAVTLADTWLMLYENNAPTYSEYKSKTQEKITEKTDPEGNGNNIVKLLQKDTKRLKQLTNEKDSVDRMIEDNQKISFMSDIYEYILNIANKKENKDIDLQKLLNTGSFDLNSFTPVSGGTVSPGNGTGQGATGGIEQEQAGDGYKTVFIVGDRTYKNYKQSDGSYKNEPIPVYGGSIGSIGCALTSVSVIATGYGIDMSPHDVNQYYKDNGIGSNHEAGLSKIIGKNCHWERGNVKQTVINQLKSGKPCMVHSSSISSAGHFFCILAISEDGTQVYVSDVGGYYATSGRNGWKPISYLDILDRCMIIED